MEVWLDMSMKFFCGILILSMFLFSSISAVAATDEGKIGTYMHVKDITAHKGELIKLKVELYGIRSGMYDSDEWLRHQNIHIQYYINDTCKSYDRATNLWGNAYFPIYTGYLEPGKHDIKLTFDGYERYFGCTKTIVLTVLP
jgi:hypothetical protein